MRHSASELCQRCLRQHRRLPVPCGMRHRDADQPPNPERACTKCGATHRRKAGWCKACYASWLADSQYSIEQRQRERTGRIGEPPPPPPGFNPRDREVGRPLC